MAFLGMKNKTFFFIIKIKLNFLKLENSPLIGTWILESSENTNAYLKELGLFQ